MSFYICVPNQKGINTTFYVNARSSNGRTADFGSVCGGSNPSRATSKQWRPVLAANKKKDAFSL